MGKVIRKSKRLSIYKKMLKIYEESTVLNYQGFCPTLRKLGYHYHNNESILPELTKAKPKRIRSIYWWSVNGHYGRRKRIQVLKDIIAEMSKQK